jgi:hypothetical protein
MHHHHHSSSSSSSSFIITRVQLSPGETVPLTLVDPSAGSGTGSAGSGTKAGEFWVMIGERGRDAAEVARERGVPVASLGWRGGAGGAGCVVLGKRKKKKWRGLGLALALRKGGTAVVFVNAGGAAAVF